MPSLETAAVHSFQGSSSAAQPSSSSSVNDNDVPLPATRDFLASVRASCHPCVDHPDCIVSISDAAIKDFLRDLDVSLWNQCTGGGASMSLPLKFNSVEDEVNLFAVIDLLNFASGYRKELHEAVGRGAFETIQYGVMAMYITHTKIDARFMKDLTVGDVSQLFGFPISHDVQHPDIPIVKTVQPNALRPLADSIAHVMNQTGLVLERGGYASLGQFVLDAAKGSGCTASNLTEKLIKAFPAFRDASNVRGQPVYIFKKAQLLCADLHRRFHPSASAPPASAPFAFPDLSQLTVFSDNVLPSMLLHHGILILRDAGVTSKIESTTALSSEEVTQLRAAAVVACERTVKMARDGERQEVKRMTETELDFYLWRVAKVGDARKGVKRVVFKDTVFF